MSYRRTTIAFWFGVASLFAAEVRAQFDAPRTVLATPRGDHEIELDGRLTESIWESAEVATGFVERIPVPRSVPPVATSFRILFDDRAILVGVVCGLSPGEVPRGFERTRDSWRIFSDDAISLKFDVRYDHRNTIGFAANPAGGQMDYVAVDNGRTFRTEFDAVWEVASHVTESEWTLEFRIPVAALGFSPVEGDRIIGFNVTRDHSARRATYDWSHLPPEFGATAATHYGEIHGASGIGTGRPLSLVPFLSMSWLTDDEGRLPRSTPFAASAGGEIRLRLGDDVWSELTVLTDFAEVDLDDAVVNLSRFPLFVPEKRPFFLSGLDVFAFGTEGNTQLFFSRRIGLSDEAEEIPLYAGLKVYGRAGPVGFGLLDVVTGDPTRNWTVSRLRFNAGDSSYVGLMGTLRHDALGRNDYAVGADFLARVAEERLELSGFEATVFNTEFDETTSEVVGGLAIDHTGYLELRYRGEEWEPAISARYVGENFEPAIGFVQRENYFSPRAELNYIHRFDSEVIDSIGFALDGAGFWDANVSRDLGFSTGVLSTLVFRNGVTLSSGARYSADVIDEAFELVSGVEIAPGRYEGSSGTFSIATSSTRNPWGSLEYTLDDAFYGGTSHTVGAYFSFSIGPALRFSNGTTVSLVELPNVDPFVTATFGSTLILAPSTRFLADFGFQYSNVAEEGALMTRIRWRYLPGADLFLVYRMLWRFDELDPDEPRADHRATIKLTYRFDAVL